MSLATRCPICDALFRVTSDQLRARAGQVRCGRCNAVFDGLAHLAPGQMDAGSSAADPPAPEASVAQPTAMESLDFVVDSPLQTRTTDELPVETEQVVPQLPASEPRPPGADFSAWKPEPDFAVEDRAPAAHSWRRNWRSVTASALLALLLVAQLAMRQRDVLAAEHPGLRPILAAMCGVSGCELALPRTQERLSIEGDEMIVDDPKVPGRITLIVTLRNSAPFAVAFPSLELSLQNARDEVLARRVLGPTEYIERGTSVADGLAAHSDVNLRLALDTGSVRAEGYRIFLFYPEAP